MGLYIMVYSSKIAQAESIVVPFINMLRMHDFSRSGVEKYPAVQLLVRLRTTTE